MDEISRIKDDRVIASLVKKDMGAMREMISRFMVPVSRISYRILCDRLDSESVTISLFMNLWSSPESFNSQLSLDYEIIRRTCRMCRVRLLRRRLLMLLSINPDIYVSSVPVVPGADDFLARKTWAIYCRAARNYTDRQKIIFTLCELEEYSPSEISMITDYPVSRILDDLEEARVMLKDELDIFGRMDDYISYLGFLRKIQDQLTDTLRLQRCILDRTEFK